MTHTPGSHDTPEPDDAMDVTKFFDSPDALADVQQAARARVRLTRAGQSDVATGTVRLAHEVEDSGIIELPTPRTVPIALLDPDVWRHRIEVGLHAAGFHLRNSPRYAVRMVHLSAVGAWTELKTATNYLLANDDFGQMIDEAKRGNYGADHLANLRADRRKEAKARRRETVTVLGLTGLNSYVAAVVAIAEVWGVVNALPFLIPAVGVLCVFGARELSRRTAEDSYQLFEEALTDENAPVTDSTINTALREAKVFTDDDQAIRLRGPIRSASINAAEATFKLPRHMTAQRLIAAKDAIAEAFGIQPAWLDIKQAGGDPTCVSMWIASEHPFTQARVSPLVDAPVRQNIFRDGALVGFTRRGETYRLRLRQVMVLLGGMSRAGKGMLLRSLICALGLDPRINIRLAAGAKPGEHIGYAPICATFFARRPARLLLLLKALLAEAHRREAYLEDQGRAKMNERDLEKFPWELLIMDEAQNYTEFADEAEEISKLLDEISGFTTALNITVVLVTQDPRKRTVPDKYKANSAVRIATKTTGPDETNIILKKGATGAGMRAHDLSLDIPGQTIVDVNGFLGELIRSFFIEDDEYDGAEPIIIAGYELRASLNRAPGQFHDPIEEELLEATGLSSIGGGPQGRGKPQRPTKTSGLLTSLLAIFQQKDNPERLRTLDILAALAEADPATWAAKAFDADDERTWASKGGSKLNKDIAQELEGTGRTLTSKEWTKGGRGRGYYLSDVRAAAGIAPE
ncbi:hypothetical protein [Streptomyces sp. NPDC097610]|uniref:hypothetical protein n=1 Tax=Streptomyces sp. NPDC097610 TaxID=3157227 RepID=UPI00332ADFD2